jgi:hypothetical protein
VTLKQVREAGLNAYCDKDGKTLRWVQHSKLTGGEAAWVRGGNAFLADKRSWPKTGWYHADGCECQFCVDGSEAA